MFRGPPFILTQWLRTKPLTAVSKEHPSRVYILFVAILQQACNEIRQWTHETKLQCCNGDLNEWQVEQSKFQAFYHFVSSIYSLEISCEINIKNYVTPHWSLETHSCHTTVRSRVEDTKFRTTLPLAMVCPVCWLIPRRHDDYMVNIGSLGVQSLNVPPVSGAALQFVVSEVSEVDSIAW